MVEIGQFDDSAHMPIVDTLKFTGCLLPSFS